jgi:hypothetical protein
LLDCEAGEVRSKPVLAAKLDTTVNAGGAFLFSGMSEALIFLATKLGRLALKSKAGRGAGRLPLSPKTKRGFAPRVWFRS